MWKFNRVECELSLSFLFQFFSVRLFSGLSMPAQQAALAIQRTWGPLYGQQLHDPSTLDAIFNKSLGSQPIFQEIAANPNKLGQLSRLIGPHNVYEGEEGHDHGDTAVPTLPDTFSAPNETTAKNMVEWEVLFLREIFFLTDILPIESTDSNKHVYSTIYYNRTPMERLAHLSGPSIAEHRVEQKLAVLERHGLAAELEEEFYKKKQGLEHFANTIQQFRNGVIDTAILLAVTKMLGEGIDMYAYYLKHFSGAETGIDTLFQRLRDWQFAGFQQEQSFMHQILDQSKFEYSPENVPFFDTAIIPYGILSYYNVKDVSESYQARGESATARLYRGTENIRVIGNMVVYPVGKIPVDNKGGKTELFAKDTTFGEHDRMAAPLDLLDEHSTFSSRHQDTVILNFDRDIWQQIRFLPMLKASRFFNHLGRVRDLSNDPDLDQGALLKYDLKKLQNMPFYFTISVTDEHDDQDGTQMFPSDSKDTIREQLALMRPVDFVGQINATFLPTRYYTTSGRLVMNSMRINHNEVNDAFQFLRQINNDLTSNAVTETSRNGWESWLEGAGMAERHEGLNKPVFRKGNVVKSTSNGFVPIPANTASLPNVQLTREYFKELRSTRFTNADVKALAEKIIEQGRIFETCLNLCVPMFEGNLLITPQLASGNIDRPDKLTSLWNAVICGEQHFLYLATGAGRQVREAEFDAESLLQFLQAIPSLSSVYNIENASFAEREKEIKTNGLTTIDTRHVAYYMASAAIKGFVSKYPGEEKTIGEQLAEKFVDLLNSNTATFDLSTPTGVQKLSAFLEGPEFEKIYVQATSKQLISEINFPKKPAHTVAKETLRVQAQFARDALASLKQHLTIQEKEVETPKVTRRRRREPSTLHSSSPVSISREQAEQLVMVIASEGNDKLTIEDPNSPGVGLTTFGTTDFGSNNVVEGRLGSLNIPSNIKEDINKATEVLIEKAARREAKQYVRRNPAGVMTGTHEDDDYDAAFARANPLDAPPYNPVWGTDAITIEAMRYARMTYKNDAFQNNIGQILQSMDEGPHNVIALLMACQPFTMRTCEIWGEKGVPLPIAIELLRDIDVTMLSLILCKRGKDLGQVMMKPGHMAAGKYMPRNTIYMQYTAYLAAIIEKPEWIAKFDYVLTCGYGGGGGTSARTKYAPLSKDRYGDILPLVEPLYVEDEDGHPVQFPEPRCISGEYNSSQLLPEVNPQMVRDNNSHFYSFVNTPLNDALWGINDALDKEVDTEVYGTYLSHSRRANQYYFPGASYGWSAVDRAFTEKRFSNLSLIKTRDIGLRKALINGERFPPYPERPSVQS